jgi:arginyl-tRNA synthetase
MRHLLAPVLDATLAALKRDGALRLEETPRYTIEPPKNAAHGDLSTNIAMVIQKSEGKPPRAIAEMIVKNLVDLDGRVAKVDIAGPGFLNFTLKDAFITGIARDVLRAGASWGRTARGAHTKKVNVEFVSANPTGPIHIGHARGSFMGDAIARLLEAAGHDVTREFYINDYGKQVETLGRTVFKRYRELFGEKIELAEGEYPAQYVIEIARAWKERDGDKWLTAPTSDAHAEATRFGIEANLAAIKKTLASANIRHDVFSSEAALHHAGKVRDVVDFYVKRGVTYEADRARDTEGRKRNEDSKAAHFADKQLGGTFLETSKHGDEEDRVILRRDGTPVYLTADLAYHKDKLDRSDRVIDILGADHSGHVPRIKAGVALMGLEKSVEFVLVQIVRITRDGHEVKVSKRKGTVFELDDLLEEAGADACRFLFLMKTANAQIDFDLGVVSKQDKENPVFTFQYGHARCAAILRKAVEEKRAFIGVDALSDAHLAMLQLPEERAMLKKLALLPDVVKGAAEGLEPHKVLYFCGELIADFHGYYTKYKKTERVISDNTMKTQARLALVAALKQTLANAFTILGVDAPERMDALAKDDDDEAGTTPEG